MNPKKNKLLYQSVTEMKEAQPFTKFTVAVGWGSLVGIFLMFVCSLGNIISIGVAVAIAAALGFLFRSS